MKWAIRLTWFLTVGDFLITIQGEEPTKILVELKRQISKFPDFDQRAEGARI